MKTILRTIALAALLGCAALPGTAADRGERFNLTFPGGTPAQLASAMAKASGAHVNTLFPAGSQDARIPAMELVDVDATTVFQSLNRLMAMDQAPVQFQSVDNVWILQGLPDRRESQVYYVGDLLAKYKIDDITTAIQTTWRLGGRESRTELKFHQDTQLLIALASKSQLVAVKELLIELRGGLPQPNSWFGGEREPPSAKPGGDKPAVAEPKR